LNPETLVDIYDYQLKKGQVFTMKVMKSMKEKTKAFIIFMSCLVDNLFADLWKQMGMKAFAASHGERTRGLVVPRRRRAVVEQTSQSSLFLAKPTELIRKTAHK
jgi:hypothetical protein